jgi:hypothetical protein
LSASNAAPILAGTSAQRTVTEDLIGQLDSAILTVDETRAAAALDQYVAGALDEALAVSRSLSLQAKAGPAATDIPAEQRNTLRTATVIARLVSLPSD